VLQYTPRFVIPALRPKITEQSRPQTLRLANVNEFAARVEHAVNARLPARDPRANLAAQPARSRGLDPARRGRLGGREQVVRAEAREGPAGEKTVHGKSFREFANPKHQISSNGK
jgi:hypothetical protein